MLRSSWGRVAPAMNCNEVQLSSRALLSFNFSLLVPHICMPIRHEHTHIPWPTCSTQGAARWHLNDIQGFTSSTLPCSVPISDLQPWEGGSICPSPQPCHLLALWHSTAHELRVVVGVETRFTLSLQRKLARGGGRNVQAELKPTGICEQQ